MRLFDLGNLDLALNSLNFEGSLQRSTVVLGLQRRGDRRRDLARASRVGEGRELS